MTSAHRSSGAGLFAGSDQAGEWPLAARRKRASLDIAAQKVIVTELVPVADRSWALADAMRDAGWDAALPRIGFEESFGQGDEVQEYRRFVIEVAKVWIASPNCHFRLPEGGPYISPYLEELLFRRDKENCKRFNPSDIPFWAREVAACLRRMELLRYAQRSEFERRFRDVEAEEQRRRAYETACHASGTSSKFAGELERPARFYKAILERETGPMGFIFDAERSTPYDIAFSKPLLEGWDLCLTSEPLTWFPGRRDGQARPLLSVQATRHSRPLKKAKWDQVMMVEYRDLVRHFDLRYMAFSSLDELEVVIMARAFLLSLTIEEIEARLQAGFAKVL